MNRWLIILGVAFWLGACNGAPPPDVCELEPSDCNEGEDFDVEACECVPSPPPPTTTTPPDGEADPADYVHIDRVPGIIDGTAASLALLHWCPDANWRDPERVADRCDDDVAQYLGFPSSDALRTFGNPKGLELCREGEEDIEPQLRKENRRCNEGNPNFDPRFLKANGDCARSEMRKTRLADYASKKLDDDGDPIGRLRKHEAVSVPMRGRAGDCRAAVTAAGGSSYDSIAGFCGSLTKAEAETGFTVGDCP